jgi:DNA-3-methyladenine glycosylase
MILSPLQPDWYEQDVLSAAPALLGKTLVRSVDGQSITARIIEVEAYRGEEDQACHARAGCTPRTQVMFGPPGRAYVYFTYGMHWCLNAVCMPAGYPAAVLIRAVAPIDGMDYIAAHRAGRPPAIWTDGPAKLTQALSINGILNGCDLSASGGPLWIADAPAVSAEQIAVSPRIGLGATPEPWLSLPWRFYLPAEKECQRRLAKH